MLPYKSDKTLGFHHDNATIKWTDNYEGIAALVSEPIIQIEGNEVEEALVELITSLTQAYERNLYIYHPFAPLAILSEDNPLRSSFAAPLRSSFAAAPRNGKSFFWQ